MTDKKQAEQDPAGKNPEPETGSRSGFLIEFFRGGILQHGIITRNLWFILLWFSFSLIYIYNRFDAEERTRERVRLEREVKNLRSEWLSQQSELLKITRQSGLIEQLRKEHPALLPATEPPYALPLQQDEK